MKLKYVYRVGRREFAENASTKGFWIGILLFPVMILVAVKAQTFLAKATPTRHFVLVDQSGKFEAELERGFDNQHYKDVFKGLMSYIRKHSIPDQEAPSLAEQLEMPLSTMDAMQRFVDDNDFLPELMKAGGVEGILKQYEGKLKEDAPAFEEPKRRFERVPLPPGIDPDAPLKQIVEALRPALRGERGESVDGEDLFAAILIPANVEEHINRPIAGISLPDGVDPSQLMGGGESTDADAAARKGVQYWGSNLADNDLSKAVERIVNKVVRAQEYKNRKVDAEVVKAIQNTHLPMTGLNPKKAVGKEEVSAADKIRQYAPVAFVYLLWIGIFTISQMLLNNTIEEKSNRIIEVLLSSVTAGELMLGKLVGIAAVGITMLAAWIGSLLIILEYHAGPEAQLATQLLEVLKHSGLLPAFAVYFVLGYFMYAGLFLTIGSVCNTLKEAQNLMGPVMLIMIVPMITMMFIPKDPNGTLATTLSWIPLYTPFIMMNRAAADPPLFDIIGTGILLSLSTLLVLWMTGKIFRAGILRTGQPPKLMEMLRWVKGS